jgi:hypothetical protein
MGIDQTPLADTCCSTQSSWWPSPNNPQWIWWLHRSPKQLKNMYMVEFITHDGKWNWASLLDYVSVVKVGICCCHESIFNTKYVAKVNESWCNKINKSSAVHTYVLLLSPQFLIVSVFPPFPWALLFAALTHAQTNKKKFQVWKPNLRVNASKRPYNRRTDKQQTVVWMQQLAWCGDQISHNCHHMQSAQSQNLSLQ